MSELTKALVKARMACKAVIKKEGKNSAQGYSYVGHEHVLVSGAREALLANGLVLVETGVSFVGELQYATRNGAQTCWRWLGTFRLMHESGEYADFSYEATTGTNDKTGFVASTALDRTAVLRVLQLAGGAHEDPEHDINERYQEAATRPAKAQKTLDDIANGGTKPARGGEPAASRPMSQTARADSLIRPSASTAEASQGGVSNAAGGADSERAQTPPGAETRGGEPVHIGELLDAKAWRSRYEAEAEHLMESAQWLFEQEDEMGLPVPPVPCPSFSAKAKNFPGVRFDDPKCVGWLRKVAGGSDFALQEADKRIWALYSIARHELKKEAGK